jgi:hypothetical protein
MQEEKSHYCATKLRCRIPPREDRERYPTPMPAEKPTFVFPPCGNTGWDDFLVLRGDDVSASGASRWRGSTDARLPRRPDHVSRARVCGRQEEAVWVIRSSASPPSWN